MKFSLIFFQKSDDRNVNFHKCLRTSMGSGMSFQVKGVVESLAAKSAKVPLSVTMTFHVTIKKPLQSEHFRA